MMIFIGCAEDRTFYLEESNEHNIKSIHATPYGWATHETRKNKNVVYEVCLGNVIWSIVGFETIFVPVWLTGWEIYEPIKLKDCAPNCK